MSRSKVRVTADALPTRTGYPDQPHRLPCGCAWHRAPDDFHGPIYWNPYNGAVQCHMCGTSFVPGIVDTSLPR